MNKSKIYKILSKSDHFNNVEDYKEHLLNAKKIEIDFTDVKKIRTFIDESRKDLSKTGVEMPFDNIIFNVKGISVPHPETGKAEPQELMLHASPLQITTDTMEFHVMLVQDLRAFDKNQIYYQSHIVLLDEENGICTMPSVDTYTLNGGCTCSTQNPFSLGLSKNIWNLTPGYKGDVGYVMPNCTSINPLCTGGFQLSRAMVGIVLACIEWIGLSGVSLLKTTGKKVETHYKALDGEQIHQLKETGKVVPTKIIDELDLVGMKSMSSYMDTSPFLDTKGLHYEFDHDMIQD